MDYELDGKAKEQHPKPVKMWFQFTPESGESQHQRGYRNLIHSNMIKNNPS